MTEVKPPLAEGRRQRRARETRRRILDAAHDLFVSQGYASTSIREIAEQADVAWQTVYSVFENKPNILSAVFDVTVMGDDEPVPMLEREFVQQIVVAAEPREKVRIFARHFRESSARTAGVLSVIESAAGGDPEIAELWRTLQDQRLYGMTKAVESFHAQNVLRPDLTIARAADILWHFTGPWAYRSLVTERGWTLDEYESWLTETLHTQLMTPAHP